MRICKECGSYAINLNVRGRDNSHPDLCDVCYWKQKATFKLPAKKAVYQDFAEPRDFEVLGWNSCLEEIYRLNGMEEQNGK